MSDPLPANITAGALSRDPACPSCLHGHLWLSCTCGCDEHVRNGID